VKNATSKFFQVFKFTIYTLFVQYDIQCLFFQPQSTNETVVMYIYIPRSPTVTMGSRRYCLLIAAIWNFASGQYGGA